MVAKANPSRHASEEVDAYLENLPGDVQQALQRVRDIIRKTVPDCTERVSYGIPMFRLTTDLVGLSAAKNHCSLHSASTELMKTMADELREYRVSGATIQFKPEKPLPEELVVRILHARMAEMGF